MRILQPARDTHLEEKDKRCLGSVGLRGCPLIFNGFSAAASGTQLLIPGTRRTKPRNPAGRKIVLWRRMEQKQLNPPQRRGFKFNARRKKQKHAHSIQCSWVDVGELQREQHKVKEEQIYGGEFEV